MLNNAVKKAFEKQFFFRLVYMYTDTKIVDQFIVTNSKFIEYIICSWLNEAFIL